MIFYFSGTGNSYDAALRIKGEDCLINITDCVRNRKMKFQVEDGEQVGFVMPVYFAGLPSIVSYFINHLSLEGAPVYTFGLITCGGEAFAAGAMLEREMKKHGLFLDAIYSVTMPDNYILMYEPQNDETRTKILETAHQELEGIREQIANHTLHKVEVTAKLKAVTALLYPLYVRGRKTDKFWVDDSCVGCGTCVKRCPTRAIELRNGKPVWIKERCVQCLNCMRCNAIQYGKKTVGRKRYANPVLKER